MAGIGTSVFEILFFLVMICLKQASDSDESLKGEHLSSRLVPKSELSSVDLSFSSLKHDLC